MQVIKLKHIDKRIPTSWDELTPKQLLFVAGMWKHWKLLSSITEPLLSDKYAREIFKQRLGLLIVLLDIPSYKFWDKSYKAFKALGYDDIATLLKHTDFIFAGNSLTVNSFQEIGGYYGPGEKLNYVSIEEFGFVETFYLLYLKTEDDQYLHKLISSLYRKSDSENYNKRGDKRKPFSPHYISEGEAWASKLDYKKKQAILLYYMGCRAYLEKVYTYVFKKSAGKTTETTNYAELLIDLAGDKFGDYEKTKATSARDILFFMDNTLKRESLKDN